MFKVSMLILALWFGGYADATNKAKVVGNPNAPKGGTFVWGGASYPKSLNYPIAGDYYSAILWSLIVESLCEQDPSTGDYVPTLASKWDISKDKKVFTFHINKKAKFSDGAPVTAHDFKAFWDIVHNPKNLVGNIKAQFDKFEKMEVIDDHTLKVYAKEVRFSNFDIMCSYMFATDRRFYLAKGKDFNKSFNSKLFGSGPYLLDKVDRGKKVVLKRNKNYWGADLPQNVGRFNFNTFVYKTISDLSVRFESFKKGDLDMFVFSVAKRWKTETDSEKFRKNWVIAQRIDNQDPSGFSGIAMNMRRPPLDNLHVRKALAHTYNREKFIKDLFYNNYTRLNSYFPKSIFANSSNKMVDFDIKKAREYLKIAGYTKTNSKGILVKNNKPLSLHYFYTSKSSERYLTMWKEDLLKVGVELNLRQMTWATLLKKLDGYDFMLTGIGFTGSLNPDPMSMWHSKFKDLPAGYNLPGFIHPDLDKLLMEIGPIFDRKERAKMFHKIDRLLFDTHPYILGWNLDHMRIGYWNKYGFIDGLAPTYGSEFSIWQYAWLDKNKEAKLKEAMKNDKALPAIPNIKGPKD